MVTIVVLLATLPLTGSLQAPVGVRLGAGDVSSLALSDGELVRLLALEVGVDARHPAPLVVPSGVNVPGLVWKLAQRGGVEGELAAEDLAAFARLDARVAEPVVALLFAVDVAWAMRDEAFRGLTLEEQLELDALVTTGSDPVRLRALAAEIDMEMLVNAAILLLDTLDGIVMPQLRALGGSDAWPAGGAWDPAGVLRIGSTGNDLEAADRIVQIDPRGNDVYWNNAGAGTLGTAGRLLGVSIDLAGDDVYDRGVDRPSHGAGRFGIGILYEIAGDDFYNANSDSQGAGVLGVGFLREFAGNDTYATGGGTLGYGGEAGIGVLREDAGEDEYLAGGLAGGAAEGAAAIGLLWDRAGVDRYTQRYAGLDIMYGYGEDDGRGWLVDDGTDVDHYSTGNPPPGRDTHGCNDCTWRAGRDGDLGPPLGRGNDNMGGLARLLADDVADLRT